MVHRLRMKHTSIVLDQKIFAEAQAITQRPNVANFIGHSLEIRYE